MLRCLLAVMLISISIPAIAEETAPSPSSRPKEEKPKWELLVLHPSISADKLCECILTIPKELPIDSIGLLLLDRGRNKVGLMFLDSFPEPGIGRSFHFSLNRELVKNSCVVFRIYPGEDREEVIKAYPGQQQTVRRDAPGHHIREPIE